jgi:hypothetical protein
MLAIKHPSHVPFGGAFIYRCKHCGTEFRHHTVPYLMEQAHKHAIANELEFKVEAFTENLCENTPGGICHEIDGDGYSTTVLEALKNVRDAAVQFVKGGFRTTPDEILKQRSEICASCEWQRGFAGGGWATMLCGKCGCSGAKLALPQQRCPVGKWEALP